jgi:uncharacterized repeat protein (TIGR01451 family)
MKGIRWWLGGGLVAAALAAAVLGPVVFGQQSAPSAPKQLPPKLSQQPPPLVPGPIEGLVPVPPAAPEVSGPAAPTVPPLPSGTTPPSARAKPFGVDGMDPPRPEHFPSEAPAGDSPRPETSPLPLPAIPAPREEIFQGPASKTTTGTEIRFGRQEPAVSIEWVGPPVVRLNQQMSCQLLVRNTGAVAVQNVVVRHRPGQGVSFRASDPQPANEHGELVWSLGTMTAGQVRRIDVQMVAQVKGALSCQATVTFSGSALHQVQVNEPQLQVKLKVPERVLAGEPVSLLFAVSNPGDGAAEAVKLKAELPEGLEHQHGKNLEVDLGSLAAKEVRTLQLVCKARTSGVQKCQAVVTADGGLVAKDDATVDVQVPKLDLVVAGPKLRYIDRKATYVLKVANPGTAPAANVVVSTTVPPSFKYHGASGGGVYDEGTRAVSWVQGDLPAGQSREVTLELVPTAPGEHRVVAQVSSARGLKTEAETRTLVEGVPALVIEVADTDDPVEVGAETTYEVRIANAGTKTETNVEVICTLPEQAELRSAKSGANLSHKVEGREVIFAPVPKLAPRADLVYRIQVRGRTAGDARFRVRVRADGLGEPMIREESTRFYNDEGAK